MKNIETKKSLGQHWLQDINYLDAICEDANIVDGDKILEIGPGTGELTDRLIMKNADVFALEFDPVLMPILKTRFFGKKNIEIDQGDIRSFDFRRMNQPYKIVANIPYYLTSNLIRLMCESSNPPVLAALLMQKEVAQRICAKKGDMSMLSVVAQFYFECGLGTFVPSKAFTPPPKVDSQVLVMKYIGAKFDVDAKQFFRIVKAGFSNRRKTLLNSLSAGLQKDKSEISVVLAQANIGENLRPQELDLQDWHRLFMCLHDIILSK